MPPRWSPCSLHKIAGDLRLMGSGPATGLAEVVLPALQPGSSIMPGKVNPVVPEAVQQVACQVVGNDAAMTFAATLSTFELNTAMPVMARNLLESLRLLAAVAVLLADRCLAGLVVEEATMRRYAESSAAVVTALNPVIGYERAARGGQAGGGRAADGAARSSARRAWWTRPRWPRCSTCWR